MASPKSKKPKPKAKAKKAAPKSTRSKRAPIKRPPIMRPLDYRSLPELRAAIDAVDDLVVPLLCRRLALVGSAGRFKPSVAGVVIQSRVEEIVDRVREMAAGLGSNPDCLESVYRHLIDAYTLEEQRNWSKMQGHKPATKRS